MKQEQHNCFLTHVQHVLVFYCADMDSKMKIEIWILELIIEWFSKWNEYVLFYVKLYYYKTSKYLNSDIAISDYSRNYIFSTWFPRHKYVNAYLECDLLLIFFILSRTLSVVLSWMHSSCIQMFLMIYKNRATYFLGIKTYIYTMNQSSIIGKVFLVINVYRLIKYRKSYKVIVAIISFYFHLQNFTSPSIAGHVKYMFTSPRPWMLCIFCC